MSLSFGKRDAQRMAVVLEPLYGERADRIKALKKDLKALDEGNPLRDDIEAELADLNELQLGAEEYGLDALEAAEEIIHAKAKFTVVGQVKYPVLGDKIALGWYQTEKQALDDALKLTYSTQTHEEHRAWVLPVFQGTPNDYYISRKKAKKAEAAEDAEYREKELAYRVQWLEEHPDEPLPDDWTVVVATQRDTDECSACHGIGRVPKEHLARRADMPRKFY